MGTFVPRVGYMGFTVRVDQQCGVAVLAMQEVMLLITSTASTATPHQCFSFIRKRAFATRRIPSTTCHVRCRVLTSGVPDPRVTSRAFRPARGPVLGAGRTGQLRGLLTLFCVCCVDGLESSPYIWTLANLTHTCVHRKHRA